jgi:hypothetical protein
MSGEAGDRRSSTLGVATGPAAIPQQHAITTEASIGHKIGRKSMAARCWFPLSVLGCAFLFLIITMYRRAEPYDEALILVGSTRVLSGHIPYRDFYANYGPAQFYVLAALFKVFGPSVLVERLWDLLVRSSMVLVIYLLVDRAWGRWRAIFLAALTGLWLSYFENYGYPVFPCLLFSLLSVYCLVPVYRGCRATAPLLASGICVGITTLFRHDVGIATAVGGVFTLGLFHLTQEPGARQKIRVMLRSGAIYSGGIALALVPPLALLVAAGAAHDMLVDLVLIPAKIYVRMRSQPFPSVMELARDVIHLRHRMQASELPSPAVYLPILGVISGVLATTVFGKNRRGAGSTEDQALAAQRLWILVQLTVFSLLFFFKGWVHPQPIQMAVAIVPSLVIITVCQMQVRSRAAKILSATGIACMLVISLAPMWFADARFERNLAWAADGGILGSAQSDNGGCFPPPGLERLRCFYVTQQQELAVIRYIQEHTADTEAIFVGNGRHDKIVADNILLYFLSKRAPVTKWYHFDPGVQTTMEIQSEMVGELQTRRPRYVVLSSEWDNFGEPDDSVHSNGVTVLDQYIRTNYGAVAAFGPITILERRSD